MVHLDAHLARKCLMLYHWCYLSPSQAFVLWGEVQRTQRGLRQAREIFIHLFIVQSPFSHCLPTIQTPGIDKYLSPIGTRPEVHGLHSYQMLQDL